MINPETGKGKVINILLDTGNNRSVLSTAVADELQIVGRAARIRLEGVGGKQIDEGSILAEIRLRALDDSYTHKLWVKTLPNPAGSLKPFDWNEKKRIWKHIKDIEFPPIDVNQPIDMILGYDYPKLMAGEYLEGENDLEPMAKKTRLGWVAAGPVYAGGLHRDQTPAATYLAYSYNMVHKHLADVEKDLQKDFYGDQNSAKASIETYQKSFEQNFAAIETSLHWKEFQKRDSKYNLEQTALQQKTKL